MNNHKSTALALFFFGFLLCFSQSGHAQKVMITSTVENFELTLFNYGCPSYGGDAAFAGSIEKLDLTDEEGDRLLELVGEFEYENGIRIRSKTETRDFQVVKDKIKTSATGPLTGSGKELCDFLKSVM